MKDIMFKGKYSNGRVQFYADEWVSKNLHELEGKDVYCNVKEFKPKRSIRQNNWYFGVAIPIIQAFLLDTQGEKYTKDDVHQYHMNTVIKPEMEQKPIFDKVCIIYKIKRTSEMSTVEFMEFVDEIQMYWAQFDLIVPDPKQIEM
jgi:hypothetical protein